MSALIIFKLAVVRPLSFPSGSPELSRRSYLNQTMLSHIVKRPVFLHPELRIWKPPDYNNCGKDLHLA
jgi:hypothetical protein